MAALTAALLPLAFGASASASSPPQPRTWHVAVGEETPNDAIQGMAFLPGTVWINKGDKIVWTAKAGEFHTVTFLAAGTTLPQGGPLYDGVSYFNSGAMTDELNSGFPTQRTYSLTFNATGDFTYYCLVHGMVMKGLVHVRAAGTHYPLTQGQYNHQSVVKKAAILRHGLHLWAETAEHATNHKVFAGADDGKAMVMRFINANVTIRKGSSVTFVNNGMGAPHTITFGPELPNITSSFRMVTRPISPGSSSTPESCYTGPASRSPSRRRARSTTSAGCTTSWAWWERSPSRTTEANHDGSAVLISRGPRGFDQLAAPLPRPRANTGLRTDPGPGQRASRGL